MKCMDKKSNSIRYKEVNATDLQKVYIEVFMDLFELSYALKRAPRITKTK